jgi:hypothetical protein
LVPNILKEEKYKYKERAEELGIHSMLAVPIYLHRLSEDVDPKGVLQIFYKEENKVFTPLEVEIAQMFSRRVGHVVALKKIVHLHELNVTKDKIVDHIYQKLTTLLTPFLKKEENFLFGPIVRTHGPWWRLIIGVRSRKKKKSDLFLAKAEEGGFTSAIDW